MKYSTKFEQGLQSTMLRRETDWRCGAIVYQVLVDRFAPAQDLAEKQHFYPDPKVLKRWDEVPRHGEYLESHQLWSHEIEFWGGDLSSLNENLEYIQKLNVDVLYLNPIHDGYTNHKYDSLDFKSVSAEFGSREDVKKLAAAVHSKNMKLVLDGVFNHMGQHSECFKMAQSDPNSVYRSWFYFSDDEVQYKDGYRCWDNASNLPELNLENQAVRDYLYIDDDSVVKGYLRDGVDGWRLDVAHDIGFNYLEELTEHAHQVSPEALVVGEVWSYPEQWLGAVDGIMNLTMRHWIINSVLGTLPARLANQQLKQMVDDCDFDKLLMSWVLLDNHDTKRLATVMPELVLRQLATVLQFTVPGSPNLYYGTELGMEGGDDPEMRAPMRWDLVSKQNEMLVWTLKLIEIRKNHRALRVGEFRAIVSEELIAFVRYTDRVEDACFILVNPNNRVVSEHLMLPYSKLMNMGDMIELLGQYPTKLRISASYLTVDMPPQSAAIFKANTAPNNGYSTYKRVN